jgi:hypothetical protein
LDAHLATQRLVVFRVAVYRDCVTCRADEREKERRRSGGSERTDVDDPLQTVGHPVVLWRKLFAVAAPVQLARQPSRAEPRGQREGLTMARRRLRA